MFTRFRLYPWLALIAISSFAACGGNAEGGDPDNSGGQVGFGGQSTGGVNVGGGGTSGGAKSATGGVSSSGAPGSGGETGCCLAAAVCDPGDKQLPADQACPAGFKCYLNEVCCSKAWCARAEVQCGAVPSCNPGDLPLRDGCPPEHLGTCYTRTLCGSTIYCLSPVGGMGGAPGTGGVPGHGGAPGVAGEPGHGGAPGSAGAGGVSCDPQSERDRKYVATNPGACALIDYLCPVNTTYFGNDCGCGCEQDASCPDYVDCMPGPGPQNSLCSSPSQCPYTIRAL